MNVRGVCRNECGYNTLTWQDGGLAHYKYRSDKQNCYLFFLKKRRCSVYTRTKQSLIHHYAFKVLFLYCFYLKKEFSNRISCGTPIYLLSNLFYCTDFCIYMKYLPLDKLSHHQSIQQISRISFLIKSTTIKKKICKTRNIRIYKQQQDERRVRYHG
jgi:hypothetical protein